MMMKLKITSSNKTFFAAFSFTPLSSVGRGIIALSHSRNWDLLGASSSTPEDRYSSFNFQRRTRIFIAPVASSSSQVEQQEEEEIDGSNGQMVHVKLRLQLRRECLFGEQFLVVGDDPLLGLWDPYNAIPMNWSGGHLWTADLNVPIDKPVQFKFILRKMSGEIFWQPGEDRTLQLGETQNIITVLEDWDNEQARLVEEVSNDPAAAFVITNTEEMPLVAADDDEAVDPHSDCPVNGVSNINNPVQEEEREVIPSSLAANNGAILSSEVVRDVQSEPHNDTPVLVPGLLQSSNNYNQPEEKQLELYEVDLGAAADATDAELDARKESDEKPEDGKKKSKEEALKLISSTNHQLVFNNDEQQQHHYNKPGEADSHSVAVEENATEKVIWENDIKWGRKTLKKFLNSLGLGLGLL